MKDGRSLMVKMKGCTPNTDAVILGPPKLELKRATNTA
jgi:hypothetical protein